MRLFLCVNTPLLLPSAPLGAAEGQGGLQVGTSSQRSTELRESARGWVTARLWLSWYQSAIELVM